MALKVALLAVLALLSARPALGAPASPFRLAPDHVLVWAQDPDAAGQALRRLGFTLRDGNSYGEGIVGGTAMFADETYLELLHFADPALAKGAQARAELAFVRQGPGANSFAVQVGSVDMAADHLWRAGFDVGEVDAETFDPDGAGPLPPRPASWRDFHFRTSPVAGAELFFIEYPPEPPRPPEQAERFAARTTHANTARRLSAVWVLVDAVEAEAAIYGRMGFMPEPPRAVPGYSKARTVALGGGRVVLVQAGRADDAGTRSGPRILGVSVEVADLDKAVAQMKVAPSAIYDGLMGRSFRPPSRDLGLFIEFHAQR